MQKFRVTEGDDGKRLDMFLVGKLKKISRQKVKQFLDRGLVSVNGRKVIIAKWEMLSGDEVEVMGEGDVAAAGSYSSKRGMAEVEGLDVFIKVVYEDRDVIVVDKPSGVVVQTGDEIGSTYVDSLKRYLKKKHQAQNSFVAAVHRLDKETSGLMVFATSKVGEGLVEQFKKHTVERAYLAIVEGQIKSENGKIEAPIKKGEFGHGKRASIDRTGEGKTAITLFLVKERYKDATFIRIEMKTGRTHQARVHMASIGHPIVGDKLYGPNGKINSRRQMLHSYSLTFKHPAKGTVMKFTAELPKDMTKMIDELRGE